MVTERRSVYVAIVNYNGWSDTVECLSSLAKSTFNDFTTIVVDNASKDGSAQRIREEFPDVEVLELDRNVGYAGGCNRVIQRALDFGASYCLVLNNDIIVDPNAIGFLVESNGARASVAAMGPK